MTYATEEARQIARRNSRRAYNTSEKGRATKRAYRKTPKGREVTKRSAANWRATPKGRERSRFWSAEWKKTPKGRAYVLRTQAARNARRRAETANRRLHVLQSQGRVVAPSTSIA